MTEIIGIINERKLEILQDIDHIFFSFVLDIGEFAKQVEDFISSLFLFACNISFDVIETSFVQSEQSFRSKLFKVFLNLFIIGFVERRNVFFDRLILKLDILVQSFDSFFIVNQQKEVSFTSTIFLFSNRILGYVKACGVYLIIAAIFSLGSALL